jgi:putative endonuclease
MREYDFYVYIVRCNDDCYYTGVTNDWKRRISEHNQGIDPHSFTFRRRPVTCIYVCHFENVHEAISWEKHIKRWSRKKKEALVKGDEDMLRKYSKRRSGNPLSH